MSASPHDPYRSIGIPEARLMTRLTAQVRTSAGVASFVQAGQALSSAIIASRATGELPSWVHPLAEALSATLAIVLRRTQGHESADLRVELATAVVALRMVRPDMEARCDDAARIWLSDGASGAHRHSRPHLLAARTLHLLLQDDPEAATASVDSLLNMEGATAGWILYDWTVARTQLHGVARETQCFHYLRLALASSDPASARASLQLLASAAIVHRAGYPLVHTLPWLHAVAQDIEHIGTSNLSAAG